MPARCVKPSDLFSSNLNVSGKSWIAASATIISEQRFRNPSFTGPRSPENCGCDQTIGAAASLFKSFHMVLPVLRRSNELLPRDRPASDLPVVWI